MTTVVSLPFPVPFPVTTTAAAARAVTAAAAATATAAAAGQVREASVQVRDFEVHRTLAQQVTAFFFHQRTMSADDMLRLAVLVLQSCRRLQPLPFTAAAALYQESIGDQSRGSRLQDCMMCKRKTGWQGE